jgi:hypoxanthine phosphoribosyltransferase
MNDTSRQWELVSWEQFYGMARQLAFMIHDDDYQPDIIIAIARGGYTPARILSDYLGVMDMTSFKVKHYHSTQQEAVAAIQHPLAADVSGQKILLVDDVSDTGDTFEVAIDHINACTNPSEVRSAVLHHKTISKYKPDYYTREVKEWHWITYPWAIMEDMTAYMKDMQPAPVSVEQVEQQLKAEHGIQAPLQILSDAFELSGLKK